MLKPDPLHAWLPVIGQLSMLAWAGARSSSRGGQLHRDGHVGRMIVSDVSCQAPVREQEFAERVELTCKDGAISSACSCGTPRCAHAVAVALELQRKSKQLQQSTANQQGVMLALRQRLHQAEAQREPPRVLRDLERLPIAAAVDMVALAWRQSLRPGLDDVAELHAVAERIAAAVAETPAQAAQWATHVLQALAAPKVVFTPLPDAAEKAVAGLCRVVALAGGEVEVSELFAVALEGPAQVAPQVAVALCQLAARHAVLRDLLLAGLGTWLSAQPSRPWKEHAQPGGADVLVSAVIDALLAGDGLSQAGRLAVQWPPVRSTLLPLVTALAQAGHSEVLRQVLGRYDARGATVQEAATLAFESAVAVRQAATAQVVAAWMLDRNGGLPWYLRLRQACPPGRWVQTRDQVVLRLLQDDDEAWMAHALASETDAATALLSAVSAGPLRDHCALGCLAQLTVCDPLLAAQGWQLRLAALCGAAAGSDRAVVEAAHDLCGLGRLLGDRAIGADYVALLAREHSLRPGLPKLLAAAIAKA